jgi:hypothetical protein
MKVTSILFAAVLALVSVEAAPVAEGMRSCPSTFPKHLSNPPLAEPQWCSRPGEPCLKAKREALALAEAIAEPKAEAEPQWCSRPGEPCFKVKREADAYAEGTSICLPISEDKHNNLSLAKAQTWCYRPGEPCFKVKRAAEALAEALAIPEAEPQWCSRPGEPCLKAKREALALAEAFAEPDAEAEPQWCSRPGEPCFKIRRAAEALAAPEAGKF